MVAIEKLYWEESFKVEVYTIGYTAFNSVEDFIDAVHENKIKCVIDVRSVPYSQYRADFNREALEKDLKKNGIMYRNYAVEFGARQENKKFYGSDGILDFTRFIKSEEFQSGVGKIEKGIAAGYSFAMMCAEKDPINCHRAIMVGQGFKNSGFTVKHIKSDGKIETQEELEQRMLDIYFKDRNKISLFSSENESEEELIQKAYILRNKDIGYHFGSADERNEK